MRRMKALFQSSVGVRLLLYFTLLMIIPLAVAGWLIYHVSDTRMSSSALRLSSQIMHNVSRDLDGMIGEADELAAQIRSDALIQECLYETDESQLQFKLNGRLKQLCQHYDMISGAYLLLDNGVAAKSRYYSFLDEIILSEELYFNARNHAATQWLACLDGSMIVNNLGDSVLSAVSSFSSVETGRPCGVIIIEVKISAIRRIMQVDLGENSNLFLLDRGGNLLCELSQDDNQSELAVQLARSEAIGEQLTVYDKENFFVICGRMPASGWTVVGLVYKDFLREDSRQILQTVLWIAAIAVLTNLVVSRVLRAYELRPIQAMMGFVQQVETGNFEAELQVVREDEIGALAASMKNMAVHINELMGTIRHEQERLRWAEYKALQAQINPHFLYNTLDSIAWLIWEGENERAHEMVTALTCFFRIGLSRGSDFIPVADEVRHIESYLRIQKLRYRKSFDYSIYLEERVRGYLTPKLLLQPLVENALVHGIRPAEKKCHLFVNVLEEKGDLVMEVRDDGIGIPPEKLKALTDTLAKRERIRTQGYGLGNVNDRIHILAGAEFGMQIISEPALGTSVRLRLPKTWGGYHDV